MRWVEVVGRYVGKPGHDADADDHKGEQANEHPTRRHFPAIHANVEALGVIAVGRASVPSPGWRRHESQHAGQRYAEEDYAEHHEREPDNLVQRSLHARRPLRANLVKSNVIMRPTNLRLNRQRRNLTATHRERFGPIRH